MYGRKTGWCNEGGGKGREDVVGALRPSNGGQGEEETERIGESVTFLKRESCSRNQMKSVRKP